MLTHGIQLQPIAERQGYLWPTLIGRSMSTNTKRAHTRNTAWSRNWQQIARALFHSHCLQTDTRLCCVTLFTFSSFFPEFSAPGLSKAFPHYHSPLFLCCVIGAWNGKTTGARFQRSPFPLRLTSWIFISMVTLSPNYFTVVFRQRKPCLYLFAWDGFSVQQKNGHWK